MPFSIAVFPFIKTSGRILLGGLEFRSTDDTADLADSQRRAVLEVVQMLYLKDDLRVASASFAITPSIDIDRQGPEVELLTDIRAVVAYAYSSPHDVFDDVFLTPEEVSLLVLSPTEVSTFLVYPEHHTIAVEESLARRVPADDRDMVAGYSGLYNLSVPLWVARGSRLYPPKPQVTLNIQQDLAADFAPSGRERTGMHDLLRLLEAREHPARARAFTALRWYNYANESSAGADRALLSLAVAFEALFDLPESAKSDRLADAISLILGRTERVDDWATQFYAARSRVVHEGSARELHYRPGGRQNNQSNERFGSLMLSGRTIFQLCMGTLLFGMARAEESRLAAKLVSNGERFGSICQILENPADPTAALDRIRAIVTSIGRHRFIQSTGIEFDVMLGALSRAASTLLRCGRSLTPALEARLRRCTLPKEGRQLLERLDAVRELNEIFKSSEDGQLGPSEKVLKDLSDEIWSVTFSAYYALKRQASAGV